MRRVLWLWTVAAMACPRAAIVDVKAQRAPKGVPQNAPDWLPEVANEHEVRVPYPEEAKANEVEGVVLLRVQIDDGGNVTDVMVLEGLGYGLDEASVAAVKTFKFRPATKDGKPVPAMIKYSYSWYLD